LPLHSGYYVPNLAVIDNLETRMSRFTGMIAFVEAAEAGSFAGAAVRMSLSRSAVGKGIARLERRLGTRLFNRTTRTQTLTEDGQVYYERCTRALAELDAAEAVLDSGRGAPVGRLRVSVPVLFGRYCAASVLLDVARKFPQLKLEVSFTDRVVDLIDDRIDLAIRVGALADSAGIVARRLGTMQMVICGSPDYLNKRGRPLQADDLAHHDIVSYGPSAGSLSWSFQDAQGQRKNVMIECRVAFDDLESIADAATVGAGLARLPSWLIAARVDAGKLVVVLEGQQRFDIHAVWPRTRHLPSKVRVAVDELVARIPNMI
jgi:DNA-binding transcriptional LysR family regulator